MAAHIQRANGDGPPGIRISWVAVSAFLTATGMAVAVMVTFARLDKQPIIERIDSLSTQIATSRSEWQAQLAQHETRRHNGSASLEDLRRVEEEQRRQRELIEETNRLAQRIAGKLGVDTR